jgi:hypothetical protein
MSEKSNVYSPSFVGARLYRKISAKGATYFAGRIGNVKLALLKSKEVADDGGEIWELRMSEAQPYVAKDDQAAKRDYARPASQSRRPQGEPDREPGSSGLDETIPF